MTLSELLSMAGARQERKLLGLSEKGQAKSLKGDPRLNNAKTPMSQLADSSYTPEQKVINYLKQKTDNPALIAGIIGNIAVETGNSFDHSQKEIGKNKSGEGLFQFTYKPMKEAYDSFITRKGLDNSSESQIDFIFDIMDSGNNYDIGAGNRNKMKEAIATNDPQIIAKAFMDYVERPGVPHWERRSTATDKYFKILNQGGRK